ALGEAQKQPNGLPPHCAALASGVRLQQQSSAAAGYVATINATAIARVPTVGMVLLPIARQRLMVLPTPAISLFSLLKSILDWVDLGGIGQEPSAEQAGEVFWPRGVL